MGAHPRPSTASLAYVLADDVEVDDVGGPDGTVVARSPYFRVTLTGMETAARRELAGLAEGPRREACIDTAILEEGGLMALAGFYRHVATLLRHQMLHVSAPGADGSALATLIPISPHFRLGRCAADPGPWRISRFAYQHRVQDGRVYLESPLSHAVLRLDHADAAALVHRLSTGGLGTGADGALDEGAAGVLALLVMGGFAQAADPAGQTAEDRDEALEQWAFHDLLFHARSRLGRHNYAVGGNFRHLGRIAPQPAVKAPPWARTVALPRPEPAQAGEPGPGLYAVMEARGSVRAYGAPITLAQLGELLWRAARVKERYEVDDKGEFTRRPYPSGGASYEMELYLTVDRCEGLAPGLYWYDPELHALAPVRGPGEATEGLLDDAYRAAACTVRPQVLVTLAARFQRVSWKYDAIAYATILKNAGVLYATLYLVATAMGLAPCGLGLGDSERFARAAGTDYLRESSVGEFMLGGSPA